MSSEKNFKEKPKLLSPGGNLEKIETALVYGADAVYMGLEEFSLRANADNLKYDQANHLEKIKAKFPSSEFYCTLNIFFQQKDIEKLKTRIDLIKAFPFDCFIISDIGILNLLQKEFPKAKFSLSTQANCLNSEAVKAYGKMGFDTVILGRETPLSEIRKIKDANPDIKLEAFVHGAMCMAYSGRCLLSSHFTGRSANQGDCSHTCRWKFRLALEEESRPGIFYPISEDNGYTTILSSKDMCMIDNLSDLVDSGISSMKIEGRMKSTYYVATVTRAYRKALDAVFDPSIDYKSYRDELFSVSHRPYSTGFYYSDKAIEENKSDNTVNTEKSAKSDDTYNTNNSHNDKSENNRAIVDTDCAYIRDYMFLGTVKEQVKPKVWSLDIKNQIKSSKKIEYIGPDFLSISDENFKVLDENFNETSHIDHGKTGYIQTDLELKKNWIIRQQIN